MFTRDPNLIKQFYLVANKPSQARWNDFFDFMASIEADIAAAYALVVRPIRVVFTEAELLAVGPSLLVGHRAKRLDNGITYVKQVETGSLITDWAEIGDTWITIPDVTDLQTELDLRLTKFDDSTPFRLGMAAEWHNAQCVEAIIDLQPMRDVLTIPFWVNNANLSHVTGDRNFTITVDHGVGMGGTPPIRPGMVMNLLVRNTSTVGPVDFEMPDNLPDTGDGVSIFVLPNTTFPVTLPQGTAAWIKILQLPIPASDPIHTAGTYYFISIRQMAEPVIVISGVGDPPDVGEISHGFFEGEYYPPHAAEIASMSFGLVDSVHEAAITDEEVDDAGVSSFEFVQSLYEQVVIIESVDDAGDVDFGLVDSSYPAVVIDVAVPPEAMSVAVSLRDGNYRDSAEETGLMSEAMNVAVRLAGGTYA